MKKRKKRVSQKQNTTTNRRGESYERKKESKPGFWAGLRDETRNSIIGLGFVVLALILLFAALGNGGHLGGLMYNGMHFLFGLGYYLIPLLFILLAINFFRAGAHNFTSPALVAGPFFVLSALGIFALHSMVDYPFRSLSLASLGGVCAGLLLARRSNELIIANALPSELPEE